MQPSRPLDLSPHLCVLLGFAVLLALAAQLPSSPLSLPRSNRGYGITAEFDNVGDLKSGAPVELAGVRIGEIQGAPRLDATNDRALVSVHIDRRRMRIPNDSDARIEWQGLLGGTYVAIEPGTSRTYLANGSRLKVTRSVIVLEDLIGKALTSKLA